MVIPTGSLTRCSVQAQPIARTPTPAEVSSIVLFCSGQELVPRARDADFQGLKDVSEVEKRHHGSLKGKGQQLPPVARRHLPVEWHDVVPVDACASSQPGQGQWLLSHGT